jgi:hypothetical protein
LAPSIRFRGNHQPISAHIPRDALQILNRDLLRLFSGMQGRHKALGVANLVNKLIQRPTRGQAILAEQINRYRIKQRRVRIDASGFQLFT